MADAPETVEVPAAPLPDTVEPPVAVGPAVPAPAGPRAPGAVPGGPGGIAAAQAAAAAAKVVKKPEIIQFQIEVNNEVQWRQLLRREGLIVVDVYSSWANPCASMVSILKRVKVEVNDDRLWYSIACSDNIDDLLMFKDQSQPTWLFMGGGKPVRVIRGSHAPNLISAIKSELLHEIQCIEGKARRNLISIDDEVSRRKKAEAEASRLATMVVEEDDEAAKTLNEIRRDSSISLMGSLEAYTIAIIQPFVIEAGNAQEIKDYLTGDFKIEQEIVVNMTEENVRNLYRIPYEIPDPVQDYGYVAPAEENDYGDDDMENSMVDGDDDDAPKSFKPKMKSKPKKKVIQIPLPGGLIGDSILLLLENVEVKKLADEGKKPTGTLLQTADDYIRLKVGPVNHKDAVEHAPFCLHTSYGRADAPGVWCPRKYDDKRYVMLNFFPQFISQMLSVSPQETKKYLLAVFASNAEGKMAENSNVSNNTKDIVADGKMKIPADIADEMLKSWNVQGGDLMTKKAALTTEVCYVVSINRKNSALKMAINSLSPIHVSFDEGYGRKETAKLFTQLNLSMAEESSPEEVLEKFLARSRPRLELTESVMDLDTLESLPVIGPEDDDDMMGEGEEEETVSVPVKRKSKKTEDEQEDEEEEDYEGFEE